MGHVSDAGTDARRAEVRARIARAHGHLHGILDMIDDARPYDEVLQQIRAVRAALDRANAVIVDDLLASVESAPPPQRKARLDRARAAIKRIA